jgi:pyrimidine-nucleoside phosphorylase
VVTAIRCRAVGHAAMLLGAGRETVDSRIDPAVGFLLHKKVGEAVTAGEPLVTVHVNDRARLEQALSMLRAAIRIGSAAPAPRPLVHAVLQ